MAVDDLNRARTVLLALGFLGVYVLLEWATYRHDVSPLGITPWNPSAGLATALLLRKGWKAAPLLALALGLADLTVRHVDFPWWVELSEVFVTVVSYTGAVYLLQQRWLDFDPNLPSFRDLCILMLCAIAGAMLVALGYTAVLTLARVLPAQEFVPATLRLWGGDVLGIMAVTPFVQAASSQKLPRPSLETGLQLIAIVIAIVFVFGNRDGVREELTYLLFLPIVWIAVRQGLIGVSLALLVMQFALIIALHLQPSMNSTNIGELQALLLILLFGGLAIGVLTSEREVLAAQLHAQELRVEHAARATGMSSFSNSLAHEISQPLTAIGNYARSALRFITAHPADNERGILALNMAIEQVERASEITRRLRSLFETGRIEATLQDPCEMAREAIAIMQKSAAERGATLEFVGPSMPPRVLADRVQIELVLNNLLRNSIEATADASARSGQVISVAVDVPTPDVVAFSVRDLGPGFPKGFTFEQLEIGRSTKPGGLGIGLGICRSIIDAHGGSICVVPRENGATVRFTLRAIQGGTHG